ncbi:MAG: COR domain-containing protein [Hyphomicrobiales bacterium]
MVTKSNNLPSNSFDKEDNQNQNKTLEAKVLIIGKRNAGKTLLYEKLINANNDHPSKREASKKINTHSINFEYNGQNIIANLWDFDGEIISDSLHQIFFSNRTVYIIVNKTEDIDNEKWHQLINKYSETTSITIAQNKKSNCYENFNTNYNSITTIVNINLLSEDTDDIDNLKNIIGHEISQLFRKKTKVPNCWKKIRKYIVTTAKQKEFISLSDFIKEINIDKEEAVKSIEYYHDLGICFYFQDNELLERKIFLRKNYIINAIYSILNDPEIKKNAGQFNKKEIFNKWSTQGSICQEMNIEFIILMEYFKLIQPLKKIDEGQYLAPKLLPKEQPEFNWNYSGNICLEYKYKTSCKGLIIKIISDMCKLIKDGFIWYNGVILKQKNTEALITEDSQNKSIIIRIKGNDYKDLMSIIEYNLEEIHKDVEIKEKKELVSCICNKCKQDKTPYFFEYTSLLERQEKKKETAECDNSYEDINIQSLLDSVFTENTKDNKPPVNKSTENKDNSNELKFFISYSKDNEQQLDKFKKYLGQYKGHYKFTPWYDGDLKCGDEWDPEIKRNLNEADLIIFLVSNDFLATDYIRDVEIETAMKRHKKGETKILPVILTDCNWQSKINPLNKITCFPEKGKAIYETSNINDIEKGWSSILKQIGKFLKEKQQCPQ